MKKNAFKLIALTLALGLGLAACGGGGKTPSGQANGTKTSEADLLSPTGEYPIVKKPVKMTMFRLAMPNVEDFSTNDFSKFIEKKTGISWEFRTANESTQEEQLNLAMANKPLPDVFLYATPDPAKFGVADHLLMPIENLIEKDMPNFSKFLKENPKIKAEITESDGHIYYLPAINDCYHCKYFNKMWVNEKHLKELGMEAPKTTDDLLKVVKAYAAKYPKGVAISGSTDGWGQQFYTWLTDSFILDPGINYDARQVVNTKTQKIESIADKDEYRAALKFMSELYKAGAIYDGTFTQNAEQYRALMNQEGDPVLFAPYGTISDAYDVKSRPESYADYRVISPLKGPQSVQIATFFKYQGVSFDGFMLSKDCRYPDAALRWADYFYTMTGYLSMQFGPDEGKDWELNPKNEKGLDGQPALYKILRQYSSKAQNHNWQDVGLNFATAKTRLGQATPQDPDIKSASGLEKLLYEETKNKMEPYRQKDDYTYDVVPPLKKTAQESNDIQVVTKQVKDFIDTNRAAFIRGTKDINDDAVWKAYVKGLDDAGLQKMLAVYQAAYDRQYKNAK